ncbi:MAG: zinc ribbon domain-containing protein [Phycisphaeraceae bacterium]
MPVYEYHCPACNTTTDALRKMADADAPIGCERCGSTNLTRKHSVFTASATNQPLPIAAGGGGGGGGGGGCACGNPHGPCAN